MRKVAIFCTIIIIHQSIIAQENVDSNTRLPIGLNLGYAAGQLERSYPPQFFRIPSGSSGFNVGIFTVFKPKKSLLQIHMGLDYYAYSARHGHDDISLRYLSLPLQLEIALTSKRRFTPMIVLGSSLTTYVGGTIPKIDRITPFTPEAKIGVAFLHSLGKVYRIRMELSRRHHVDNVVDELRSPGGAPYENRFSFSNFAIMVGIMRI